MTKHHEHEQSDRHDHAGHNHAPKVSAQNERRIAIVFTLTASYALIQAVGGWLSGSLALIADSGHMVSDAAALLLALIAYRVARRPADARRSYGYHRVRVLAALANGATLLLLVAWITVEAVRRLWTPVDVMAGPMLIVAALGLVINVIGAVILNAGHQGDGNLRGAYLHVLGDLLGSVGAIAAALGIMATGWMPLDPLLSVLVAVLVVRSAWQLIAQSLAVLLQATPEGLEPAAIAAELRAAHPEIEEVGHFHAWALADEMRVATLHVTPAAGQDPLALPPLIAEHLAQHHNIQHCTVQVDPPGSLSRHSEVGG